MATDLERMVVRLEAQMTQYHRELQRARGETNKTARAIEGRFQSMASNIRGGFRGLGAGVATFLGAREIVQAADAWTNLGNKLKSAGFAQGQVAEEQQRVLALSQETRSSLSATGTLYAQLVPVAQQYGRTAEDAEAATRNVAEALKLAGADGNTASGALRQLGQALQSGKLRGDEFNSIMEALGTTSPLIQAIAKEFNVTATELRDLAEEGELVSGRVLKAIVEGGEEVNRQFKTLAPTVSDTMVTVENAFQGFIGQLDQALGLSNKLAAALAGLALVIRDVGNMLPGAMKTEADLIREIENAHGLALKSRQFGGAFADTAVDNYMADAQRAQEQLDDLRARQDEAAGGPLKMTIGGRHPEEKKKKGGGGGRAPRERHDLENEIRQIRERTTEINLQTAALGQSTFESQRAAAMQELMNAAQREGTTLTAAQRAEIEQLATDYANAQVALEKAKEAQERINELWQEMRSAAGGAITSFLGGLREGKSVVDSLKDSLDSLIDSLLQMSTQMLLNGLFGTGQGPGGLLGPLLSGITGGVAGHQHGTNSASGGLSLVGESGPELVNLRRGSQVIPNDILRKMAGGGGSSVEVNIINQSNATVQQSERNDGGRPIIDIVIAETKNRMARGEFDAPMQGRYGARPRKVR